MNTQVLVNLIMNSMARIEKQHNKCFNQVSTVQFESYIFRMIDSKNVYQLNQILKALDEL